jgi:proline iminopeptidase
MENSQPRVSGMLAVGDAQQMYWEEVGPGEGRPIVWLHGGPGGGASGGTRRLFDSGDWRAVLYDQRGAGRSRPSLSDPATDLSVNTTSHLVADIERLREDRGIESWTVAGGSWGCTLAQAYAIAYPERVDALVLVSVTTAHPAELSWITREVGRIFPEAWEEFVAIVPHVREAGSIPRAYAELLASPEADIRLAAARAWCRWEDAHMSLPPGSEPFLSTSADDFQYAFARAVTHYWSNDCFLAPDYLERGASRLADIPIRMIHGRWDVSGPVGLAWDVKRLLPHAQLTVLESEGHGGPRTSDTVRKVLAELHKSLRD